MFCGKIQNVYSQIHIYKIEIHSKLLLTKLLLLNYILLLTKLIILIILYKIIRIYLKAKENMKTI